MESNTSPVDYATLLNNRDQLQEGVEGVEGPGAEEAEDLGTHDVGQGADVPVVEDQEAVVEDHPRVEDPAVVQDHPGVEDPEGSRPRTGDSRQSM